MLLKTESIKWVFLLSCMFSVILCIVFSITYKANLKKDDRSITISVWDESKSQESEKLLSYMENTLDAKILLGDQKQMENQLITFRAMVGVKIPEGFAQGELPQVIHFEDDKIAQMVSSLIDQYVWLQDDVTPKKVDVEARKENAVAKALKTTMGFLPQALMIMAICLSIFLVTEKQEGNLMRIYISPVSFLQYMLGRGGLSVLVSLIPAFALWGMVAFYLGYDDISVMQAFENMVLFTIFMMLTAFYLDLRCTTQNTIFLGIVGLTSVGSIIGGCFFSIDGTVKVLETIAKVLPHYWLMKVGQGQFLLIYIVIMIVLNFVTYEKLNKNGGKIG